MLILKIRGTVREAETEIALASLLVKAYDQDLRFNDLFESTYTNEAGRFEIVSAPEDFREFFDVKPSLYLAIFTPDAEAPLYTTETPARWIGWRLEEFDVRIPRDQLGDLASERKVWLLGDDGAERGSFDVGEPLIVRIGGVRPVTVHDVVLRDGDGSELFTSRLLSDRSGVIEATAIWPQIGLDDPHSEELFSVDQARIGWQGKTITLEVYEGDRVLMERVIQIAEVCTRPIVLSTDNNGVVRNGFEAGEHAAIVSGYNVPFQGQVRVYMVPRQHGWWPSNVFTPVRLASGRPAFADVHLVEGQSNFRVRIAEAAELAPGAYDFIVRRIRYGYEDDEDFQLRAEDLVGYRTITGLVVRQEFMSSKTVLGGCVNALPISGRTIDGPPYFQYGDTFQVGEDIYGALDPAALLPNQQGKMVALYVIKHPTPQTGPGGMPVPWNGFLFHIFGNPSVQKLKTQVGCINFNKRLLWPNALMPGEYDIIADFGNNTPNATAFVTDGRFNSPLDIIDGYYVAGFRVMPDPTTYTTFPNHGVLNYKAATAGVITVTDELIQYNPTTNQISYTVVPTTLAREGVVYFPADASGGASPTQPSSLWASYPVVVMVHGNGHSYTGYNYLLEHLAQNGFIAASIHLTHGMGARGRAEALLQHLAYLKTRFGTKMANNIGLIGHSRGGEAVIIAAYLNQVQQHGYFVRAVISLAPTASYRLPGTNPSVATNLSGAWAAPYLVIYGAMDGDVSEGDGFGLYDRASGAPKSMVFIYGATHNRFADPYSDATELDTSPLGKRNASEAINDADAHQTIAKAYMNAFFRQHLLFEPEWDGMFRGEWIPTAVTQADGGRVRLYVQHDSALPNAVIVDNFEGVHTLSSWHVNTLNEWVDHDCTLPVDPVEQELRSIDTHSPHATAGCLVRWNSTSGRLRFTVQSRKDVSSYSVVSFRVTQKVDGTANLAGQPQDLYLSLKDLHGRSRAVRIGKFGVIPAPQKRYHHQYTKSAMCTIRIPLHVFTIEVLNTDRVDLKNVESVTFEFKAVPAGEIEIDSLEFTS